MSTSPFQRPIWDRGEPVDSEMLAFTIGDDWLHDRRLVAYDIRASQAHVEGLAQAGLLAHEDATAIRDGLHQLLAAHGRGEWTVEAGDEDVHSAVERRLIALIGDPGKRLNTGRSRNEQVAVELLLWLRDASAEVRALTEGARAACARLAQRHGALSLPGYTHLRRATPSTAGDWALAHARAFELDLLEIEHATLRTRECPLGSGAGYGVPLALRRDIVARLLGFERPAEPVTYVQHARGRAELAWLTALEQIALDVEKLASDLWLFSSQEFGFVRLPVKFTTGSSLMPHKRNPDILELLRAHARQVIADRIAVADAIRGLPSGYHRDFQLIKPPLFRAHDRIVAMLVLLPRLLDALEFDAEALQAACADPKLRATERALEKARSGVPFRDAYRDESRGHS
ncbi:MAG: argininosuccinate lyase [Planctomycetota bacterium]